jgi:uncharacterized protein
MFLLDGAVVYSASDLTEAAGCEFAVLRRFDEVLGRLPRLVVEPDAMHHYAARLGDEHERRVLAQFAEAGSVHEVVMANTRDAASLLASHDDTIAALRSGVDVVFQGSFFDGRFHGRADFLVREPGTSTFAVYDTKLARHAKITALLQLAAYADQMIGAGVSPAPEVHLILGDGSTTTHRLADLLPVYRVRRARLEQILAEHRAEAAPATWNDPRYIACGRCDTCRDAVASARDVLLVAGLRSTQRAALRAAGISTIDQLATRDAPVDGMSASALRSVVSQAALQVRQDPPGAVEPGPVTYEVFAPAGLVSLPEPSPGDVFFDFEGDPLWSGAGPGEWGLEYLFGVVEVSAEPAATPSYRSWWADDRAAERQALVDFLDYVERRRARYPHMHIYHYAAYEKTALLRLAGRFGVGEDAVDALLRDGVLVDLFNVVRSTVRVSQPSYSIKKLEPLYMGADLRTSDVTSGGESVVAYDTYTRLRDAGQHHDAAALQQQILDYNAYDCRSTLGLRDWLLGLAQQHRVHARAPEPLPQPQSGAERVEAPLVGKLLELAGDNTVTERDADHQAIAMAAAALGYHQREDKPFWWAHFDRLARPVDEWTDTRDVLVVETAELIQDWFLPQRARTQRRRLKLAGRLDPGSSLTRGTGVYGVYDAPLPPGLEPPGGCVRAHSRGATIIRTDVDDSGLDVLEIEEMLPREAEPFAQLPMALAPQPGPRTDSIAAAIRALAEQIVASAPTLPDHCGIELLRRRPPRLAGVAALPPLVDDPAHYADVITAAVLRLDRSYLAVQGPPGTGKTYVGARVIAALVRDHGWRVGVVAQSHAVVENMLAEIIRADVPAEIVGKKANGATTGTWTVLGDRDHAHFLAGHHSGCVLGGTAWDFTNTDRVAPGCLDLLVVDEAGQFAVANTLAVSIAATRLLLLGDPQQLPQVSQGRHPEPVELSALAWLAGGHDTLPPEFGYFLERTWRMHPALCAPVSALAYADRLHSHEPITTARGLDGIAPGVHVVTVAHRDNSVQSVEEADAVATQVHNLIGRSWADAADPASPRRLRPVDVLVVAPYNAQVALIRRRLGAAGLSGVRVGTVDKFQGQQAPVVVVSMTASSARDIPRGIGFLLSRNRLNVAVSRAQWCAIVVRSDALSDFRPSTPEGLAELGAFIGLCGG